MPVVAQVWRDEVVARRCMIGQIGRQLVIWPDVGNAFGRLWIQPIVEVVLRTWPSVDIRCYAAIISR